MNDQDMPNTTDLQTAIDAAARCVESADALVILAGAGMGVDSGLPDYRGDEGLWRAYPRLKHLGLSFEEMASPKWFDKDPKLAWAFYGHRQQLYRETKPHRGYTLLKEWGEAMPQGHFVYTSNVDGHFQFARFQPERLVECHGNIHVTSARTRTDRTWQETPRDLDIDMDTLKVRGELPRCPECNAIARPNVLMFFDRDWVRDIALQQLERYNAWIDELRAKDAMPFSRSVPAYSSGHSSGVRAFVLEAKCHTHPHQSAGSGGAGRHDIDCTSGTQSAEAIGAALSAELKVELTGARA
jgi:NAD-dependent SIR2 family protein deacetylase